MERFESAVTFNARLSGWVPKLSAAKWACWHTEDGQPLSNSPECRQKGVVHDRLWGVSLCVEHAKMRGYVESEGEGGRDA